MTEGTAMQWHYLYQRQIAHLKAIGIIVGFWTAWALFWRWVLS